MVEICHWPHLGHSVRWFSGFQSWHGPGLHGGPSFETFTNIAIGVYSVRSKLSSVC